MAIDTTQETTSFDEVIASFREGSIGITHLVVSRGGAITDEWYRSPVLRTTPHMLHSATKSFVSAAAGMAVADGLLSLDAPMIDYLPTRHHVAARGAVRSLTVRDLLTMRTGHARGSSGVTWRKLTTSWIAEYLGEEIVGTPGKDFIYSSGTSHMLSACVQQAVGIPVDEYLSERLFTPLGFGEWSWSRDPEGISSGGNGLTLLTTDLAKWGQLYLQKGQWEGRTILDPAWVEASTSTQVEVSPLTWDGHGYSPSTDPSAPKGGYGYQIWLKDGSFSAQGMFGQVCLVVPDADMVVAVNSALPRDKSAVLVDALLPAVRARAAELDASKDASRGLFGTYGEGEVSVRLEEVAGGVRVSGRDDFGPVDVIAGLDAPRVTTGPLLPPDLHHSYAAESTPISASATLISPGRLRVSVDFLGTPFVDTIDMSLESSRTELRYSRSTNVNSGTTEARSLILRRV